MTHSTNRFQLYFLAIVPDRAIQDEITTLKKHFEDEYASKHALRTPPHITLHMPFRWREDREKLMVETLQKFAITCDPFEVVLKDYGAFTPRVIYISVQSSEPLLSLQKNLIEITRIKLKIINDSYKNKGFHPHITVAFRDLSKANFVKALGKV